MIDDRTKVKVTNRIAGYVTYNVPEMQNLSRTFTSKETKLVDFEELRRLMYVPGGQGILEKYLIIEDKEVLKELGLLVEPEYFYNEEEIKNLFVNGTLDEFLDCLDFAPDGVLDTIKLLAVQMPLNDVAKRQAILDKTGFDVTRAIELQKDDEPKEEAPKAKRRAAVPGENETSPQASTGRRVIKTAE